MAWRNCNASNVLLAEVNARWPRRDKRSDGTVGDPNHRGTGSDHNPNSAGVVRARDIDVDGILATKLAEHIRLLGSRNFRPLRGGYVIYNRRIAGTHTGWQWREYNGPNPHTTHIHISFADAAADYDARDGWNIRSIGAVPPPKPKHTHPTPVLRRGDGMGARRSLQPHVKNLQADLRRKGSAVSLDGMFGQATANAVVAFQRRARLGVDGVVGPATWRALHS